METLTQKSRKQESLEALKKQIVPGDVIHTTVRHVSKSGMYRAIDAYIVRDNELLRYSWTIANALGYRYDKNHEAIGTSGCGQDMAYAIVHNLGYALFPEGFECIGGKCPSNDHSNGDRDYKPHHHKSGGYSLNHKSF